MDTAHDVIEINEKVRQEYRTQTIILINSGKTLKSPIGYSDFNGTSFCMRAYYCFSGAMIKTTISSLSLCSWKVECSFGTAWCTDSNYEAVVKTRPSKDPKYVFLPQQSSKKNAT